MESEISCILRACNSNIRLINNSCVNFIRRQASQVVHTLFRVSRFSASLQIFYYAPPCINALLLNDMR
ncbi:hypothetical protein JHK82_042922 [Glycine max]|uniref:Uncharacterized protein n=2 Tax=Glycine subgen. Soja TaxID=1462606 RepID=A0A0R0GBY6_SOYBN|nr:hypothetical protein JHK87_042861 [Glycine soja]KAG4949700.1 hypothetical protein JHK86_042939 [Glycine max]KAG4957186.1 hypothetical protein JHK85_043566 [Glycine max]KAG5105952.1 hypothetical protein JHK82_042922 [Glycine max]KAG5117023.1 hypothetical protein JHK84_043136 [Glycine max]